MSSVPNPMENDHDLLRNALGLVPPETPFPWQERLLERFRAPDFNERALDIPTGLGKTAVMAIWLVARALGARHLPRRLVYVVDRRAVVDQATEAAVALREWIDSRADVRSALELGDRPLPISTLRGQHADNREWLEDPGFPSIVVGTVDMVGSRLLFEGYGVSRKMRPYHAGLLGADTLLVLDEAHLVPPFERLLDAVTDGVGALGPRGPQRGVVPRFRLLSLSATGRARVPAPFGLDDAQDLAHPIVSQRLNATKRLRLIDLPEGANLADALAQHAWELAGEGKKAIRCIVFCDSREDAGAVAEDLQRRAKGDKKAGIPETKIECELLVGARRVREREAAMGRLRSLGFVAGSSRKTDVCSFVVATAAGEVGVDLDADHMVSDLVPWERMVQRLGRVNRRGHGAADVLVLVEAPEQPPKAVMEAKKRLDEEDYDKAAKKRADEEKIAEYDAKTARARALRLPIERLPRRNDAFDASPGAIRNLKARSVSDPELAFIIDAATTPAPLHPALTRPLVDAWSMTSLRQHTGRPIVGPWLRGWVDEKPETTVVWRRFLPTRNAHVRREDIESFFEAAPPHLSESLETESYRIPEWLITRAAALQKAGVEADLAEDDAIAVVIDHDGGLNDRISLRTLVGTRNSEGRNGIEKLEGILHNATLIVDRRLGGLSPHGLLDENSAHSPPTADDADAVWIAGHPPNVRFRIRVERVEVPIEREEGWTERLRFVAEQSAEGEPVRVLVIEKWREDGATEDDRSSGRLQLLADHQSWTEERAREMARRLGLSPEHTAMLAHAARLHDEGKRAPRWQRAFSAPAGAFYAKTRGPLRVATLEGYRHEFGSLPRAESDPELAKLPAALKDLALHLIAAHHGFARPVIATSGCEDAPPSALEGRAREVALRFIRLQKEWGPWGLAWWESLLRAADQQASRDNDAAANTEKGRG